MEESVLESLKVKADFQNFKPRPFNMREFYDRTGHDLKEMMLSCHFHGTECRAEDFTVVSGGILFYDEKKQVRLFHQRQSLFCCTDHFDDFIILYFTLI